MMTDWQLTTPVAFLIFNRPDTTRRVFSEIARAKPPVLLVIADGPRAEYPADIDKCAAARAIIELVDWPCQVVTNYADSNMGCKRRVSSGLDWVFNTVDEAIILEDDCLPHPTFFRFCAELLTKYRHDERIMAVSGDNFQFGRRRNHDSYYFSRYNHIWGWASWRRAWQYYDVDLKLWPQVHDGHWLKDLLMDSFVVDYWAQYFQSVYDGQINTWDYQWTFACWIQNGLTILPNVNLISNIGFNAEATHTAGSNSFANLPTDSIRFPLQHPPFVIRDVQADSTTQNTVFGTNRTARIKAKTKRFFLR